MPTVLQSKELTAVQIPFVFVIFYSGLDSLRFHWYQTRFIRKTKIHFEEWTKIFAIVWILLCSGKPFNNTVNDYKKEFSWLF